MRLTVFGFLFLTLTTSLAQNRYRSRASGDWNNPSIWQVEALPNGSNLWSNASNSPDFSADIISLGAGHTITITESITLDQTRVNAGVTLIIQEDVVVTINNGAGVDMSVNNGAIIHLLGESNLAGPGYVFIAGELNVYSTNPSGAITPGTLASGNLRTATRNFGATARVRYVGSEKQFLGAGHPSTSGLTTIINNNAGVEVNNTSSTNLSLNGNLNILSGQFLVRSNNLRMGASSTITINGGSLDLQNSTAARSHAIQNLTLNSGSVSITSTLSTTSITTYFYGNLNLVGGSFSLNSGSLNNLLVIYGDITGSVNISSSGSFNFVSLLGNGDLSRSFPFASNSTIRQLTINRPGLSMDFDNTLSITSLNVLNGAIDFNTSQIISGALNLAAGTSLDISGVDLQIGSAVNSTHTGGLFISNASSNLTLTGTTSAASTLTFAAESSLNSLTIDQVGGGVITLASSLNILSSLNLLRGTLNNAGGFLNLDPGTLLTRGNQGSLSGSAPTGGPYSVTYTGTSLTTGLEAQGSLNNLTSSLSGTLTVNISLNLAGDLTINSGTFTSGTHAISANDFFSDGLFNAPSSTLSLSGNLTNNGPFNANNGEVIFNGDGTQNISGTSLIQFNDLTLATGATVSIQSNQNLRGVLTLNDNATFDADGSFESAFFTVLSVGDAAGSDGSVAALGLNASISGNISVQRYWGAVDNVFRYFSSPVGNGTLQQLIDANVYITGYPGSDFPCNGDCDNDNANLSYYDETQLGILDNGWTDFPGASGDALDIFTPARGYSVYMWNGTQPTLWTSRGTANQGSFPFSISHTLSEPANPFVDGWNLIGNPYPSSIRWEDNTELPGGWTFGANIDPTVWLFDEEAQIWLSYNRNSNVGNFDGTIATGQAFWIQVTTEDTDATLEVHEAAKTDNSGAYYRTTSTSPLLTVSLSNGDVVDNAYAILQSEMHSKKLSLGIERMSLAFLGKDGERIAYYSLNDKIEEIPLSINVRERGEYTLRLNSSNLSGYYLIDKELNEIIPAEEPYTFNASDDWQTFNDRFVVSRKAQQEPVSIIEEEYIQVYPNPFVSSLTVRIGGEIKNIAIINNVGQSISDIDTHSIDFNDGVSSVELDLADLQQGIYIVRVVKADRSVYLKKIIKQ